MPADRGTNTFISEKRKKHALGREFRFGSTVDPKGADGDSRRVYDCSERKDPFS